MPAPQPDSAAELGVVRYEDGAEPGHWPEHRAGQRRSQVPPAAAMRAAPMPLAPSPRVRKVSRRGWKASLGYLMRTVSTRWMTPLPPTATAHFSSRAFRSAAMMGELVAYPPPRLCVPRTCAAEHNLK
jgi:hypothetical protein